MDRMSWLDTVGSNQTDFHFYVFHIDHVYAHVCVMLTWGLCQVPRIGHVYANVCVMCTWGLCQVSCIDHVYAHVCLMCTRRQCQVSRSIIRHPMPLKWGFSLNLAQAGSQQAQGPPVSALQNVGLHNICSYLLSRLPTPSTIPVKCPLCPPLGINVSIIFQIHARCSFIRPNLLPPFSQKPGNLCFFNWFPGSSTQISASSVIIYL